MGDRVRVVLLASLLVAAAAWGEKPPKAACSDDTIQAHCPSFIQSRFFRLTVGGGGMPRSKGNDGHFDLNLDYGLHPFNGAFATGIWTNVAASERWGVVSFGAFFQFDLMYIVMSYLWFRNPPATFPFHLQVGGRGGLDISRSSQPSDAPQLPFYELIRPAAQLYANLEWTLTMAYPRLAAVLRGAVDYPIGRSEPLRWSMTAGLSFGFDPP